MKTGLTVVKDNLGKMVGAIDALTSQRVMVGVPDVNAGRRDDPISNAAIAYIQDNGSPDAGIPARPFMVPGIAEAQPKITGYLGQAAGAAFDGDAGKVQRGLHAAGLTASTSIRNKITDGPFQALAEATLEARRARGRTGTKPLIDTGQLRASITYVLRKIARRP